MILIFSVDLQANWNQTSFPTSTGPIYGLAVNSTTIFAGTFQNMYRSMDNGTSWVAINSGLPNLNGNGVFVQAISTMGSDVFTGTGNGFFLSTNNGSSWSAINSGLVSTNIFAFAVMGTKLFMGSLSSGGVGPVFLTRSCFIIIHWSTYQFV